MERAAGRGRGSGGGERTRHARGSTVLVAMRNLFCGHTRARLTSPAWLICCVTCTLPAVAPKPPAEPSSSSYCARSASASAVGKCTCPGANCIYSNDGLCWFRL